MAANTPHHSAIPADGVDSNVRQVAGRAQPDRLMELLTSKISLIPGSIAALISVAVAMRKTVLESMDFQWSGAHLLLLHSDPWAIYLSNDPRHQILLNQIPNYLQELYILLLPFGLLPFAKARLLWGICNLFLVFLIGWNVAHLCELGKRKTWLLFVLLLCGTPFRVTVGNGQSDAVVLAAIALWAIVRSQSGRGLLLGIAYGKYSFPPVLVIFLLMRRHWKLLIYSLLPPVMGFLLVKAWLPTSWRALALEPFLTAVHKNSVSSGWANIIALAQGLLLHLSHAPSWTRWLPYGLAVLLACAIAGFFLKNAASLDGRILLACLLSASLVCFQHQIYDFLVLVFNLAIALKSKPGKARNAVFALTAYFWYLERIFDVRRWEVHLWIIVPSFLLLLWLIEATCSLRKTTEWSSRWEI